MELPTPPHGGSWVVLLMRCLLIRGRLSVVQPRTDDKEAPMNRHAEDLDGVPLPTQSDSIR